VRGRWHTARLDITLARAGMMREAARILAPQIGCLSPLPQELRALATTIEDDETVRRRRRGPIFFVP
jgi:hypothetical protein